MTIDPTLLSPISALLGATVALILVAAYRQGATFMTFSPGGAFIAALAITVPVWAQTPLSSEETAPGGTVVLRGSPASSDVNAHAPERTRRGPTSYPPVATFLPPGTGWDHNADTGSFDRNYDTGGFDRNYDTAGYDQRSDRNYDTTGFDRRFDRSGRTR
jgi:hypothetical protein